MSDRDAAIAELDALPEGTILRCRLATGPASSNHAAIFERFGTATRPWLEMDPSDREDGETTWPSSALLAPHLYREILVIYTPPVIGTCSECERRTRPIGMAQKDGPAGSVAYGAEGLCRTCWGRRKYGKRKGTVRS